MLKRKGKRMWNCKQVPIVKGESRVVIWVNDNHALKEIIQTHLFAETFSVNFCPENYLSIAAFSSFHFTINCVTILKTHFINSVITYCQQASSSYNNTSIDNRSHQVQQSKLSMNLCNLHTWQKHIFGTGII
jgi:hypothetical protein